MRPMTIVAVATTASMFVAAVSIVTAQPPTSVKVPVTLIDPSGVGKPAGTVTITETANGLELVTALQGLPPGEHGFHLHEKGSCDPADKDGKPAAGEAAGGHYDPAGTKAHKGPGGGGHKGDLPKLVVNPDGTTNAKLEMPGLRLEDAAGRALVIHQGGDNYSDAPKPLGGGGARIACGVIPGGTKAAPAGTESPS